MSSELDELIRGERAFLSSSATMDEKLWTSIAGSVMLGAPPRIAIAASGIGAGTKTMGAKITGALLAKSKLLVAVAAIGGVAGVGTVVGLSARQTGSASSDVSVPAATPRHVELNPAPVQGAPLDTQSVAEPQPGLRVPAHHAPATPPAAPSPDTFTEELAMIRKAQRELAADNPSAALVTLREHRRQFGVTQFAEDRSALTALALCASGKLDEGRSEAQRLLRRAPTSVYSNRLRALCVMPGP